MSKEEVITEEEAERRFKESVIRFADAYIALTDEEKEELLEYMQGRCQQAEEEYKKRNINK